MSLQTLARCYSVPLVPKWHGIVISLLRGVVIALCYFASLYLFFHARNVNICHACTYITLGPVLAETRPAQWVILYNIQVCFIREMWFLDCSYIGMNRDAVSPTLELTSRKCSLELN